MVDRPILRFPDPEPGKRVKGEGGAPPPPKGPGKTRQGQRFQATFDSLERALATDNPEFSLREDPSGIAPERALVFITAGNVQNFVRAAEAVGLEVFAESKIEELEEAPEGFQPPGNSTSLPRTLYATMPTLDSFESILRLWNAHQRGEEASYGKAPWWNAFDLLLELRPWGPQDRLSESARSVIEDRLLDESEEVLIELEIWPTANAERRRTWARETEQRILSLNGRVVDRSVIAEVGFTYQAILAGLPVPTVRAMLDDPAAPAGLATLEGIQFILPQMIGQAIPGEGEGETTDHTLKGEFSATAPLHVALFDGVPAAAHTALDGGVEVEDIHDLVGFSQVNQRFHATEMASLILRGDLEADGEALRDTRLISVPLLIDSQGTASAPTDKLFVDLVHIALTRLLAGEEPLAKDVFVINFSIGVRELQFAGRMSVLARLLDWWAERHGVLFVVSAGNITEDLVVPGISAAEFEDADESRRKAVVRTAMRKAAYKRTLLAPAEALNVVTVGAISGDLSVQTPPQQAGIISLENETDRMPQITSALGLGPQRSIKPDLLAFGGRLVVRARPAGDDTRLVPVPGPRRTGLVVASPGSGPITTRRSRGTSHAAALTTRAILQSAAVLTGEEGPYEGQELPRRMLALLTRALAVNASQWPEDARKLYAEEMEHLGSTRHAQAKAEVCRNFGHGIINGDLMRKSPDAGVTLVGYGVIRKDQARIFNLPLPASMAGSNRVPRSMRVTLAWFSPTNPARAQYRLAGLEAVAADGPENGADKHWVIDLESSDGPDANQIKRGTVWSRRLINRIQKVPDYAEDAVIPICVQCRDTTNGGLSPDDDIDFAIAVTLQVETTVEYDILEEIKQRIRPQQQLGAE